MFSVIVGEDVYFPKVEGGAEANTANVFSSTPVYLHDMVLRHIGCFSLWKVSFDLS